MRALVIVGKAPRAGQTKTRLVPPLSGGEAAELYQAFLLDTLTTAQALGWERITLIHPREDGADLHALLPDLALLEQPAVGLENALSYAFEHHFAAGFTQVVLIGSDSPTLPLGPILAAEQALANADVTIGPTRDGGYYLIGMCQPRPELFTGIAWSTPRVYAQTVERARELRLEVQPVPEWYDVDEPADLAYLAADLAKLPASLAANTRALLRRWDQERRSGAGPTGVGLGDTLSDLATSARPGQQHD